MVVRGLIVAILALGVSFLLNNVLEVLPGDIWVPTVIATSSYFLGVLAQRLFGRRRT